jgi:hypothetical protein
MLVLSGMFLVLAMVELTSLYTKMRFDEWMANEESRDARKGELHRELSAWVDGK